MEAKRGPVVQWNCISGKFENLGDETFDVPGRVLVPVEDDERTVKLQIREFRPVVVKPTRWLAFRWLMADLIERLAGLVRP